MATNAFVTSLAQEIGLRQTVVEFLIRSDVCVARDLIVLMRDDEFVRELTALSRAQAVLLRQWADAQCAFKRRRRVSC